MKRLNSLLTTLLAAPALLTAAGATLAAQGGPVGYWQFDEGSGTTVTDATGNGNDGTLHNGPTWWSDPLGGYYLDFAGSDDRYVEIDDTTPFRFVDQSLTFAAWAHFANDDDTYRNIVCLYDASGLPGNPHWQLAKSRSGYWSGKLYMEQYDQTGGRHWARSDSAPTVGQWMHVAGVVDLTAGEIRLYVDGVLQNEIGSPDPYDLSTSQVTNLRLTFGCIPLPGPIYGNPHDSYLDEIRIYDRALTPREIQGLACNSRAAATFRNDAGNTNPAIYVAEPPVLGHTWAPTVDLTTTGNTITGIAGYATPLSHYLTAPDDYLLVNIADPMGELVHFGPVVGSGLVTFPPMMVPSDPSLCGFTLCTQAYGALGGAPVTLTNAYDLICGRK